MSTYVCTGVHMYVVPKVRKFCVHTNMYMQYVHNYNVAMEFETHIATYINLDNTHVNILLNLLECMFVWFFHVYMIVQVLCIHVQVLTAFELVNYVEWTTHPCVCIHCTLCTHIHVHTS